jgi:hypothetical protein
MSLSRLAALLSSAACLVAPGETPGTGDPVKRPVAELAGEYRFGNGLGMNFSLTIEPEGRFSYAWRGCTGFCDASLGEAKLEAGHLILKPDTPVAMHTIRGHDSDLIPVRWGERLYLVPPVQRWAFCNQVNQGGEPRNHRLGGFYLRQGDWDKRVTGLPSVPREWDSLLLKKPLIGRVIEVLSGDRAKVDLGADDGVWKGMKLWADTEGSRLVQVVEVGPKSCVIYTEHPGATPTRFQKGQGVRSKLPTRTDFPSDPRARGTSSID